jgi:hypothetical protein
MLQAPLCGSQVAAADNKTSHNRSMLCPQHFHPATHSLPHSLCNRYSERQNTPSCDPYDSGCYSSTPFPPFLRFCRAHHDVPCARSHHPARPCITAGTIKPRSYIVATHPSHPEHHQPSPSCQPTRPALKHHAASTSRRAGCLETMCGICSPDTRGASPHKLWPCTIARGYHTPCR